MTKHITFGPVRHKAKCFGYRNRAFDDKRRCSQKLHQDLLDPNVSKMARHRDIKIHVASVMYSDLTKANDVITSTISRVEGQVRTLQSDVQVLRDGAYAQADQLQRRVARIRDRLDAVSGNFKQKLVSRMQQRARVHEDATAAAVDDRLQPDDSAARAALGTGQGQRQGAPASAEKEPGRNDPCPCGSGKKYKKCHGRVG